jgi:hypothetical protein
VSRNVLLNVLLISVLNSLVVGISVEPAYAQNKLVIQADLGKDTIDKNIYGHFSEHLGRCVYEGYWVGEDSPIPNTRGIRNDVVEALKKIKVPVLRWPGGCFADAYHWRDGIGPRENTSARTSFSSCAAYWAPSLTSTAIWAAVPSRRCRSGSSM